MTLYRWGEGLPLPTVVTSQATGYVQLPAEVSYDAYAGADDQVCVAASRTDEEIVRAVRQQQADVASQPDAATAAADDDELMIATDSTTAVVNRRSGGRAADKNQLQLLLLKWLYRRTDISKSNHRSLDLRYNEVLLYAKSQEIWENWDQNGS